MKFFNNKRNLVISFMVFAVIFSSALFFYIRFKKPQQSEEESSNFSWIFGSPSPLPLPSNAASPSPKPKPTPSPLGIGPVHRNVRATVFWVGEGATSDNEYISNTVSAWDRNWQENYGGVDNPDSRDGYHPSGFEPKQNPFYFALPYNDLKGDKSRKENSKSIPWYSATSAEGVSIVKNRWIQVSTEEKTCYAQWEDVGPGETDDFDYVFGNASPKNSRYGIDLSPAVRDCLDVGGLSTVWWQFIDNKNVPAGPWKEIVTGN